LGAFQVIQIIIIFAPCFLLEIIMEQPELGKRISDIRKTRGLTQKELAEQCRINERTLQRIETGEVKPRAYTISVIFEALGDKYEHDPLQEEDSASSDRGRFNLKLKRRVKIWILSATVLVAALVLTLIFATGGDCVCWRMQTTAITSVDAEAFDVNPHVQTVKLAEQNNDATFFEGGTFADERLQVSLPETLPANVLYRILVKHPNIKRSDPEARFAFAKMEGYDKDGNLTGTFELHNTENHIQGQLIYADRDVTVTGKDNSGDIWCLSLKRGWNVLFFVPAEKGLLMNTADPGDMKWFFL
jgi:transcriptional regulator with XRE-family HTH domain